MCLDGVNNNNNKITIKVLLKIICSVILIEIANLKVLQTKVKTDENKLSSIQRKMN